MTDLRVRAPGRARVEGAGRLGGLHVLADDDVRWSRDPVTQARAACAGGARVVQLRAKHADDRQVLAWAAAIRGLTRRHGVVFLVNDRFDLALAAGADGVHLGQDDLPTECLPPRVRRQLLVGRSTHTPEQVVTAREEGVDYVAFGPVFATGSKRSAFDERGLDALRRAVALARPLPLHEGHGKVLAIVEDRADGAQREALLTIMSGGETEPGATMWNVFASTMDEVLDPVFKPIDLLVDVEGRIASLKIEGLIESSAEPIRNPVTGAEHRARIDLPEGFEYTLAEIANARSRTTGAIELSFDNTYAQLAHIHLNNNGVVR